MREQFKSINFSPEKRRTIAAANRIIAEYQRQGFKLTLRQLFYQFVQANLIENKHSEYKRLGTIIDDGRQNGDIDWDAIEDRTRNLDSMPTWFRPSEFISNVPVWYQENPWGRQPVYIEVWIEKDALTGVIDAVCRKYKVSYFACRGNVSQSEMYAAAQRFGGIADRGQSVIILHLGDHDPSGLDMTRDNITRLKLFSHDADIEVRRLALNMDQIYKYKLPHNPAKATDARFEKYGQMMQQDYGYPANDIPSWELDALNPSVIVDIISQEIESNIDWDEWKIYEADQKRRRAIVKTVAENWGGAVDAAHAAAGKDAPDLDDI